VGLLIGSCYGVRKYTFNRISQLESTGGIMITDTDRLNWLIENVEYKPPGYDGCDHGRFDMICPYNENDLRKCIDKHISNGDKFND